MVSVFPDPLPSFHAKNGNNKMWTCQSLDIRDGTEVNDLISTNYTCTLQAEGSNDQWEGAMQLLQRGDSLNLKGPFGNWTYEPNSTNGVGMQSLE